MVAWSCLGAARLAASPIRSLAKNTALSAVPRTDTLIQVRTNKSPGGHFQIQASTFNWNKLVDIIFFYSTLGLIPVLGIVLYCNIFIGPATLKPIPEGYEPEHWEYHAHPISRFIARYIVDKPQKTYEKMCYAIFCTQEEKLLRELEEKVRRFMAKRADYQGWYYRPAEIAELKQNAQYMKKRSETGMARQEFPYHV